MHLHNSNKGKSFLHSGLSIQVPSPESTIASSCSSRWFQRTVTFTPVLICSLFQCIYILLCSWLSSLKAISWLLLFVS